MKKFLNYLWENVWFIGAVLGVLTLCFMFDGAKLSYHRYKVKVVFCDDRPPRYVEHYGMSLPRIDNESHTRHYSQALSKFEYTDPTHHKHELLDVCEVIIFEKEYLGDYTLSDVPDFTQVK